MVRALPQVRALTSAIFSEGYQPSGRGRPPSTSLLRMRPLATVLRMRTLRKLLWSMLCMMNQVVMRTLCKVKMLLRALRMVIPVRMRPQ